MRWWMWLGADLTLSLCIALLIRRFWFMLCWVKGKSMLDTLNDGEMMLALRYGKGRPVRRFDVVICRYPGRKGYFVKRVIGLPGESISMLADVVYINGEPIQEDFSRRRCVRRLDEVQLGADAYFVMGDNRPCSRDSRAVGPIDRRAILGRCTAVLLPFSRRRRLQ